MAQAVLVTERLRLEPLAEEHLAYEIELDAEPEVMRYLTGRARTPEEVREAHLRRLASAREVDGLGLWAGFRPGAEPDFVGLWMLMPSSVTGQGELGYRTLQRHWRQGLTKEGSRELVRHGFADLGLGRIRAQTMAVNAASRATMASLGLCYVRTFTERFDDPLPGTEHGEVEYEIRREDWQSAVAD